MSKLRVLYVDDEPDIREVATMSLELDPTIEVRPVESGSAAISLLLASGYNPDVILLDVMMPVLDGPGTLAQIRNLTGHSATPVIFITARAQAHEQDRLIQLGAMGVITKPFDPMSLATELRALLGKSAA